MPASLRGFAVMSGHTPGPYWGEPRPDLPGECEEAAAWWRKLADEQEARLGWDHHAIPSAVAARAATYREAAARLDARAAIAKAKP